VNITDRETTMDGSAFHVQRRGMIMASSARRVFYDLLYRISLPSSLRCKRPSQGSETRDHDVR
jgi:hypothetical protein